MEKVKVFTGLWIDPSKEQEVSIKEIPRPWYSDYYNAYQVNVIEDGKIIYQYSFVKYNDAAKEVDKINETINKARES